MRTLSRIFPALLLLALCFAAGCTNIQTSAVSGTMTGVLTRHDAYVSADPTLSTTVEQADLAESAFLRTQLTQSSMSASSIATPLTDVCNRLDAYTTADLTLTPLQQRVDLRDTAILREILTQGSASQASTQPVTN